jgi:hypothetical protein
MTTREDYKQGQIRAFRMSTMRGIDTLDGVDKAARIVCDCFVYADGTRVFSTPQDVEKAVEDETLSWDNIRYISEKASEMTTGGEKKED